MLRNCAVYQFHDTSNSSNFKNKWDSHDDYQLRSDGGNLASVLLRLEQRDLRRYEYICMQIGRVLPGFNGFAIEEDYGRVILRRRPKWSDKIMGAHLTSDRSLRSFALGYHPKSTSRNVTRRNFIGRTGTGLASFGYWVDRGNDQATFAGPPSNSCYAVSAVGG